MPKLIINPGTPQAKEYWLRPGDNFVGREFANDLQISDPSVSASHAQIIVNGPAVHVKDLGSTNGTFVNREPVAEAPLQPGQLLRFGGVETMLVDDTSAPAAPPAAAPAVSVAQAPPHVAPQIPIPVPVPPPPTAGSKLRLGGVAPPPAPATVMVEPPPVAAAVPAPPAVAGMIELPDGKSACKFHPKNPAQWLCTKCNKAFCPICVTVRRTGEATSYNCRTCGTVCLPVKVKYAISKEKVVKEYSDGMILARCAGFGFGAVVLMTLVFGGLAYFMGLAFLMLPPFLIWGTGGVCGLAIKIAAQDRPGIIFTLFAMGSTLMAVVLGIIAASLLGGHVMITFYTLFGLIGALFTSWKLSGGDF